MQLQQKLNKNISKILFIAPRYHTNQIPICRVLKNNGYEIDFYVKFFGKTDGFIGFDKANIKNKINKSTTAINI